MASKKTAPVIAGVPRVNLMPVAETERRERLALTRTWAGLAILAVVVTVAVIGGSLVLRWSADQALAAEQARTDTVTAQLAEYAPVSQGLAAIDARAGFRAEAMANDFAWTPLVKSLVAALPKGATMIEYSITPGGVSTDAAAQAQVGGTGTLYFSTADARKQAATVAAIAAVPGVMSADAGEMFTASDDTYEFTVSVVLDQTIYSGDFAIDGEKK